MRILRGFLKNDEFGLGGRQALRLQQQSITAAAAEQSFDVAVDRFYHTQWVPSSGSSSGCPRDDPATCGLVSPSTEPEKVSTVLRESTLLIPDRGTKIPTGSCVPLWLLAPENQSAIHDFGQDV